MLSSWGPIKMLIILSAEGGISQNGTGGFYMFGGQGIWSNNVTAVTVDGGKTKDGKASS